MIITLAMLRGAGASRDRVALFETLFGEQAEVTTDLVVKHAEDFDWYWAAANLLSWEGFKAFKAAQAEPLRAFDAAMDDARCALKTARAEAERAYKEARARAFAAAALGDDNGTSG